MPSLLLEPEEIKQLTGYSRKSGQYQWLTKNGFYAMQRADGKVIISREHVLEVLNPGSKKRKPKMPEFNNLN